jgi:hypothetical protein
MNTTYLKVFLGDMKNKTKKNRVKYLKNATSENFGKYKEQS